LLDKLDMAGVENYDVHIFPDSDHGIFFHNANRIVYDSKISLLKFEIGTKLTMLIELNNWLINAFNGEWLRTADAVPSEANIKKREIGV
jgi:dipeptidyl aminopeptidase